MNNNIYHERIYNIYMRDKYVCMYDIVCTRRNQGTREAVVERRPKENMTGIGVRRRHVGMGWMYRRIKGKSEIRDQRI